MRQSECSQQAGLSSSSPTPPQYVSFIVLHRDQDHIKYSQTEQRASFCVFKTTSSVMTDNYSLATKSVTGIGNPPG